MNLLLTETKRTGNKGIEIIEKVNCYGKVEVAGSTPAGGTKKTNSKSRTCVLLFFLNKIKNRGN